MKKMKLAMLTAVAVALTSANVVASYPIVLVAGSERAEDARAFIGRVLSPEGQAILRRHGFIGAPAREG